MRGAQCKVVSIVAMAFLVSAFASLPFKTRVSSVTRSELEGLRGLSKMRSIIVIRTCSAYNTSVINDPSIPNPPGVPGDNYISVDACEGHEGVDCVECDVTLNDAAHKDVVDGKKGGYPTGYLDPQSKSCGKLYVGKCHRDEDDRWTCNDTGSEKGFCVNVTDFDFQTL